MQFDAKDAEVPGRESSTWRQGGKFWIYGIFSAFGIFIGGVAVFLVIAFSQDNQLVRQDYYEAESGYDKQQARTQAAIDDGRRLEISYDKSSKEIRLDFGTDQSGPLVAKLHLYRAADARQDEMHEFSLAGAPYTTGIKAEHLARGKWTAKITWIAEQQEYFSEVDLII